MRAAAAVALGIGIGCGPAGGPGPGPVTTPPTGSTPSVSSTGDTGDTGAAGPFEERMGFVGLSGDGLTRLWEVGLDGGEPRELPMVGYYGIWAATWSGDGRKVAFTPFDEDFTGGSENLPVLVMNTDGTGLEQVGTGRVPALNRDGTILVWAHGSTVDLEDGGEVPQSFLQGVDFERDAALSFGKPGALYTGETEAFGIDRMVVRELGGDDVHVATMVSVSASTGYHVDLLDLTEGPASLLIRSGGDLDGVGLLGADLDGVVYWAELRVEDYQDHYAVSASNGVSGDVGTLSTHLFSPNAVRTLHWDRGQWWFGTPFHTDQVPSTVPIPIRGYSSWFEVR